MATYPKNKNKVQPVVSLKLFSLICETNKIKI